MRCKNYLGRGPETTGYALTEKHDRPLLYALSHVRPRLPLKPDRSSSHREGVHFDHAYVGLWRVQNRYRFVEKLKVSFFKVRHSHRPAELFPQILSQIDVSFVHDLLNRDMLQTNLLFTRLRQRRVEECRGQEVYKLRPIG